jgi:hypothetical protein
MEFPTCGAILVLKKFQILEWFSVGIFKLEMFKMNLDNIRQKQFKCMVNQTTD